MNFSLVGIVIVILLSFFVITAKSFATYPQYSPNNTYTQCTVNLPDGAQAGICVVEDQKYYKFYTCEGSLVAFIEYDALARKDGPTCGSNYKGYNP